MKPVGQKVAREQRCCLVCTTKRKILKLSERLQNETDKDFIEFTHQKIDDASSDLLRLSEEFEGGHVGDIHSRFNEFSSSFHGPQLEP